MLRDHERAPGTAVGAEAAPTGLERWPARLYGAEGCYRGERCHQGSGQRVRCSDLEMVCVPLTGDTSVWPPLTLKIVLIKVRQNLFIPSTAHEAQHLGPCSPPHILF